MRLAYMGGTTISQSLAENIQFNSNTTLLDFDVLLWSPNFFINEYFSNAASMKYQNGGLIVEEQTLNKIKKDVSRRDREMNIMLDNGKNLFIYTPYPIFIYDPNAQVFNLLDNFTVLRVKTSSSSGKRVEFRGDEIFAPFWEKNKNILEYQAVFDDVIGKPLFYIQGTQFVVGSYIKVKNGHISFLPAVNPNMNNQSDIQNALDDYVHTLIALDKELKKDPEDIELPDWSKSFALPHEYEQRGDFLQLEEELNAIKRKVNEKKRLIAELEKNKILFTGTGKPLELQAKKVFEELGFTVTEGEPGRDDLILQYGDKVAVVEVKGIKKSAAESHARQLEQWVSEYYLANNGVKAKGILIANAFKDVPLSDRNGVPFPNQMVPFSQAREHCLMTGLQLLGLYLDCKENDEKKQKMIELLFITNGVFPEYQDWTSFIVTENV